MLTWHMGCIVGTLNAYVATENNCNKIIHHLKNSMSMLNKKSKAEKNNFLNGLFYKIP